MDFLKGKIVVFGLGKSGISTLKLLKREGAEAYAVNQGEVASWFPSVRDLLQKERCFSEVDAQEIMKEASLIILSPGIPRYHELLKNVKAPIWSEIELASHFISAPIVAVTGTNGKTTTVSLMEAMLSHCRLHGFVGGNIGTPFCEAVLSGEKYEVIVLELSSFQLESIESFHPKVAMILNVTPNHGERYSTVLDYRRAKCNLAKNMTSSDYFLLPKDDDVLRGEVAFNGPEFFDETSITMYSKDFDLSKFKLVGKHNKMNLYCALWALSKVGVSNQAMQKGLESFTGVHFRMELLYNKNGLRIFNDAKSTNWDATLTALHSLKEDSEGEITLILGGQKRGRGDSILTHKEQITQKASRLFLFGETKEHLKEELSDFPELYVFENLEEVLQKCVELNLKGDLLFSPAFPSFDQFQNYVARGDSFSKLVNNFWK